MILKSQIGNTSLTSVSQNSTIQSPSQIPALANGQRSILILRTNNLKSESPKLVSAWLLIYIPTTPRLVLLPIFPSISSDYEIENEHLQNTFKISSVNGSHGLDPLFVEALRAKVPWWSGYIVIDNIGFALVLDIWFRTDNEAGNQVSKHPTGKEILANMPKPWEDAASALEGQLSLFQEMCQSISNIDNLVELEGLSITLDDLILSDLNLTQLLTEIQNQRSQDGGLICETPSLASISQVSRD